MKNQESMKFDESHPEIAKLEHADDRVVEAAYAKINLTLEVLSRRADGYHNIYSVAQTVDLCDRLIFSPDDRLRLECDDPGLNGDDNLALQAARVLQRVADIHSGAKIELLKRIPVAAGMGGGSADAAAALRGLNRLWKLGMTADDLMKVGASLGADVPFLVNGGTALISGIGETVERLPGLDATRFVIAAPKIDASASISGAGNSKTARMFGMIDSRLMTSGSLSRKLAVRMRQGGDAPSAFMFNVFQVLALQVYENWRDIYNAFQSLGASDIMLTGSGPAMFALSPSKEIATAWAALMQSRMPCSAYSVACAPRIEV